MKPTDSIEPGAVITDEITVELDGVPYRNWETLRLSREINAASGTFELSATLSLPWPAKAGVEAKIRLGGEIAATGYVDAIRMTLDEKGHSVTISGRDRTSDLVDCSVPPNVGQLSNLYLEDIAHAMADPYEVQVEIYTNGDRFERFTANQGDTAWAAIERAARMRGRVCYPTPDGKLRIAELGTSRSSGSVREGEADLELRWEVSERFQLYVVRGQGRGSDQGWGSTVAGIQADSFDGSIRRPRTLVVVAESAVDVQTAQDRADWEKTVRAARSAAMVATLRGWRQKWNGPLWRLNQLVPVNVPRWKFAADLLVDGLEFSRSTDGTKTTLRLVRPDAYLREPSTEADPFDSWAEDGGSESGTDEGF